MWLMKFDISSQAQQEFKDVCVKHVRRVVFDISLQFCVQCKTLWKNVCDFILNIWNHVLGKNLIMLSNLCCLNCFWHSLRWHWKIDIHNVVSRTLQKHSYFWSIMVVSQRQSKFLQMQICLHVVHVCGHWWNCSNMWTIRLLLMSSPLLQRMSSNFLTFVLSGWLIILLSHIQSYPRPCCLELYHLFASWIFSTSSLQVLTNSTWIWKRVLQGIQYLTHTKISKTIFLSEWDHQRIFDGGAECGVPLKKTWKTWKTHCKDQTVKPSSDIVFWTIFAVKMFVFHLVISCFARFLNKAFKKAGMFPSVFQFGIVVKWITKEHFYKGTSVRGRACMCCELWGHMHVFFFFE